MDRSTWRQRPEVGAPTRQPSDPTSPPGLTNQVASGIHSKETQSTRAFLGGGQKNYTNT